jgi:hypothetical protein
VSEERNFLSRWSRRKLESAKPAEKPPEKPPVQSADLPPVDSLTFDSDFTAYLAANVEESVKRAALKKLLHDPRFNVMDGLDTYIDDYTKNDPIPEAMLKTLEHARSTFLGLEAPKPEASAETAQAEKKDSEPSGDPRQDA